MGYTKKQWGERYSQRSDMSTYLIHLTKGVYDENGEQINSALEVLNKILNDKKIVGSTTESGYIIGKNKAVCFQDMPLSGVCQNILFEQERTEQRSQRRYVAAGLAFSKDYIYSKGGRPVFYEQKDIAKELLDEDEWWRIVNLNLDDSNNYIDWTHEREWRLKGDFEFDLREAVILLGNGKAYRAVANHIDSEILKQVAGINMMSPIIF
ncbi:DUF2971 domain-containing protein [Bacillus cereus]|uniref:DUF2971 domain-containing protein n=1 Tax=Bacillus cereus TaxID=1396 RepID=UPI000BFA729B|nr:DUF2971 domain-containing protein [Bacillus cereus]PFJ80495.1 DUF2971 domain-containing protein [Bacillus cereus]PFP18718.1 DUF2971 domain-containing protein [Bacillus cereus]PGZ79570.1 DUF2971 domain-containing protein [Bacillus cereus]